MSPAEPKTMRCAIYTRKSTEENLELDFNSLDAQREAGENYIASQKHAGWLCLDEHYDDGGFSGGNIDRLAFQRLMALTIRFEYLLTCDAVRDQTELAELGHITRSRITQIMNLLHLAPDIQEEILFLPRITEGKAPIIETNLRPLAADRCRLHERSECFRGIFHRLIAENILATAFMRFFGFYRIFRLTTAGIGCNVGGNLMFAIVYHVNKSIGLSGYLADYPRVTSGAFHFSEHLIEFFPRYRQQ